MVDALQTQIMGVEWPDDPGLVSGGDVSVVKDYGKYGQNDQRMVLGRCPGMVINKTRKRNMKTRRMGPSRSRGYCLRRV